MEKLKPYLTALLCLLLLFLPACTSLRALPDHRATAFRAELRWEAEGQTVCALAEYGPPTDRGTPRDLVLRFSAPASMEGLVLSRIDGTVTLESHGLVCDGSAFAHPLSVAELLVWEGTVDPICDTELGGLSLRYAELRRDEGNETLALWLDPESGVPRQAVFKETTLTVLSFEKAEPQKK